MPIIARAMFRVSRSARAAIAVALLGTLLAGCAGGSAAPVSSSAGPTPSNAGPASPVPSGAGPVDPDAVACQEQVGAAKAVRNVVGAIKVGPVLPAGVAYFLLGARDTYAAPGVRDAGLAAARREVVAAIDDLDSQGKAKLPPGGDPLKDPVQLDPARVVAAVNAVDRECAGRI